MFVDTVVIGAGVVGLAIARRLSQSQQVMILEQAGQFGTGISSRNSEVIHAGIYYPQNSLKTQLCRQGQAQLYQYCQQNHIDHQAIGKLIVASNKSDITRLQNIEQQARNNGLKLEWLNASQCQQKQAGLNAEAALWSAGSGIIDSHGLMQQLLSDAQANQAELVCQTQVLGIEQSPDKSFNLQLNSAGEECELSCRLLINAAGLNAQQVASCFKQLEPDHIPPLYYCHGQYFSYHGKHPFQHLVYPIPQQAGLGIHATLDLAGQLKFGPDSHYQNNEEYWLSEQIPADYIAAIQAYWPGVDAERLSPSYCGIRPKLQAPDEDFADFIIRREDDQGAANMINLFGIESPGLSSCLAIADYVATLIKP